ncbi:M48 family metallopeptidase [Flavobacterium sp. '19STA2R22 D10 B1']|uniref:M48 family metallopeptidase n=1 Tax=Flavobacterium aerium TaxID=3037261 RepID=UPI00278BC676|nr:M48 family metallopeptidase [Flavobacterium sp. '19STA2R22 D10 B1']
MKSRSFLVLSALLVLAFSCSKNPFTGKSNLNFVSNSELFPMAFQQYDQFITENKVVTNTTDAKRVETVGIKIKSAAEKYLNAHGYSGYLNDYKWEYKLVDDKAVNAWCMPGGKIVFFTGILPICKDDAGMATVMGHEVAHALVNHGAQRMSASQLQQLGAVGLSAAVGGKSTQAQNLYMQAYGVGTQYGALLPFSRSHESEADMIGLTLMAIAGYNPDNAVPFWERMAKSGGAGQPEFLSTHPSNQTRIENLKKLIPQAKAEAAKYGIAFK